MSEGRPGLTVVLPLFVAVILVACETVPITGRSQLQLLSASEEAQMGAQAYRDIVGKAQVSSDPPLNALVTRVGSRIAAATGRTDYR